MLSPAEQAEVYWNCARILRGHPAPHYLVFAADEDPARYATESLCLIGTVATVRALRERVKCEWRDLVPVQPSPPSAT